MLACSVGSSATGSGGNRLVMHDAHAASEANSDLECENAVNWFKETWSSRANKISDRWLVIGQRIRFDDVCGEILKNRPDWVHLNLPSEFEPERKCFTSIGWSDPRQTPGELLWKERFDKKAIEMLLLDQQRGHLSNPEQQKKVYKAYIRYMFEMVAIETVYYQLALVQQLRQLHIFDDELDEWVDISIPTMEWFPGHRDKVARASVGSLKMEQGDMYFRRNAHYLADLESEIVKFPKGKKDQVDTLSMMADIIATRKAPRLWGGEK